MVSSAMGIWWLVILLVYAVLLGLVVLAIYALILAIKALKIYIAKNSL
jgi:hypothetical protein